MSIFSECLEKLRDRRGLTNTKMAYLCGLDKTVISRWLNGQRFPMKWDQMQKSLQNLQLSDDEWEQLRRAYERTNLGEDRYKNFEGIINMLSIFQQEKLTMNIRPQIIHKNNDEKLFPDFVLLNKTAELLVCLEELLFELSEKDEKKLYMRIQDMPPEMLLMLNLFCYHYSDCQIHVIVYMNDELSGSQAYNIWIFKEMVSLLIQKNRAEVFYVDVAECDSKFAENQIISDSFVLQYHNKLSYGFMTSRKEWLSFFREEFLRIESFCRPIIRYSYGSHNFLKSLRYEENTKLYRLSSMPCLDVFLNKVILSESLYPELPDREYILYAILRRIQPDSEMFDAGRLDAFFCAEGLRCFMETGVLQSMPQQIYSPVSPKRRCEMLKEAIRKMREGLVVQHMCKSGLFPDLGKYHIEYIQAGSEEKLTFSTGYQDGIENQFVVTEKKIVIQFRDFFHYLADSTYVYTEEETLVYMEQVLRQYIK